MEENQTQRNNSAEWMKYFTILSRLRIDIQQENTQNTEYISLLASWLNLFLCFQMRHTIHRHGQGKQKDS